MKKAIYHPNLGLFGGGEALCAKIAEIVGEVDILTKDDVKKEELEGFFDVNLRKANLVRLKTVLGPHSAQSSILLRASYPLLEKYDLVIDTCTNGWFDRKLKAKTFCYVHFPQFQKNKPLTRPLMKHLVIQPESAFKYDKIVCNSRFTQDALKRYGVSADIIYPPVATSRIKPGKKDDLIVSIGRFTYEKKHEVMIDAFRQMGAKGWKLVLVGAFRDEALYKKEYLSMLKEKAKGLDIEFMLNVPHPEVIKILQKAKIYWHARGYGEKGEEEHESFGMTTVEAMAAGCIPVVIHLGAQPEIIGKAGFLWETPEELGAITEKIISGYRANPAIVKRA
ncbi:MAG: glycosyltransferase [Nanoarchaeota archaeon]|nr:glycosyltransferase [Nanoarchaeota archaeon]